MALTAVRLPSKKSTQRYFPQIAFKGLNNESCMFDKYN